jgi:hypothetical protein
MATDRKTPTENTNCIIFWVILNNKMFNPSLCFGENIIEEPKSPSLSSRTAEDALTRRQGNKASLAIGGFIYEWSKPYIGQVFRRPTVTAYLQ